jgi:hypothetical protein
VCSRRGMQHVNRTLSCPASRTHYQLIAVAMTSPILDQSSFRIHPPPFHLSIFGLLAAFCYISVLFIRTTSNKCSRVELCPWFSANYILMRFLSSAPRVASNHKISVATGLCHFKFFQSLYTLSPFILPYMTRIEASICLPGRSQPF